MKNAFLVVVGTGLFPAEHLTVEARAWLERADHVVHAHHDPDMIQWLIDLNPHIQALPGNISIPGMSIGFIIELLATGKSVCLALPGHPAVYQSTGRSLVAAAREAGYRAWLTPAVTAEDCLFANLGVDPGRNGGQSFTATYLLLYQPVFDPTAALFLWGLDQIGQLSHPAGLSLLQEFLERNYTGQHPLTLYTPPGSVGQAATMQTFSLTTLDQQYPRSDTLLYVPPRPGSKPDPEMRKRIQALSVVSSSPID